MMDLSIIYIVTSGFFPLNLMVALLTMQMAPNHNGVGSIEHSD